jgi:hypothetical protein
MSALKCLKHAIYISFVFCICYRFSSTQHFGGTNNGISAEHNAMANSDLSNLSITFAIVLNAQSDLSELSNLLCALKLSKHILHILITQPLPLLLVREECSLPYTAAIPSGQEAQWLREYSDRLDVVLSFPELPAYLPKVTHIHIPRHDLAHCGWMASLSAEEWKSMIQCQL